MFVKICGIKESFHVDWCIEAGADAFGFVVGATHETSDEIDMLWAKKLATRAGEKIKPVLVTHLTDVEYIVEMCKIILPWGVQLQGDVEIVDIVQIRLTSPSVKIIKAIHVLDGSSIQRAKQFESVVDYILLDSRTPTKLGGTGLIHDWGISREIVTSVKVPVILAGGLTPGNVASAISTVRPFGVDVNTGTKGENGEKSEKKIKDFVQNARGAFYRVNNCITGYTTS